jgi:hypothetical protein
MPGEANERPTHGGRLEARLSSENREGVEYVLALSIAEASWEGRAAVAERDGSVRIGAWSGEGAPPAWLAEGARVLLRFAWQRRRAGHPWPRRLARWRPGPESDGEASQG